MLFTGLGRSVLGETVPSVYSSITCPKEWSRPFLFVCFFVFPCKINQQWSIWFRRVSCKCPFWSLKQAEEVCVDLHDHGNHNRPFHKSSSSTIGSLSYSSELFFGNYVG